MHIRLAIAAAALSASALALQNAPPQFPPLGTGLTPEETTTLQAAVDALSAKVKALTATYRSGAMADRVADVEVLLDAVRRPLKYDERLYAPRDTTPLAFAQRTIAAGMDRAGALAGGHAPWMEQSGVRGFYSRLDGSAQPYLLTLPEAYDAAAARRYRLDVFLHGRDDQVLELQFMTKPTTGYASKPLGPGTDRFMVQPYGRYSNANRIAGEVDGLEAIEAVASAYPIDRDRIVMTGFSMGGAAAWGYTVHYADRWAAAAPGAGFSETAVFLHRELERQPQSDVQRTLWHLYDATDWALNTFDVPVVAYSGGNDAQKQAADAMAAAMSAEGLTLEHVIGPNTGHAYEPGARQQLQDRLDRLAERGRNPVPRDVRFTTWTLRYNRMFWVTVDAMVQHWTRARVDARIDGTTIHTTTSGVTALDVSFDPGRVPFAAGTTAMLDIDGSRVALPALRRDGSLHASLIRSGGAWTLGQLPPKVLRKTHGLQGPIDDAFMAAFVFVRPTGTPFSAALGQWERAQAAYAASEWVHFFRGEPRVKNDVDVTDADLAAFNVVLFGDPSSNAVYKRIAPKLPIRWRPGSLTVGGRTYDASHAPVFIYPNPLNPRKYIVVNTGFTFHDQSNNAMQTPKLGDWAVVDITKPENNFRYLPLFVEAGGFFDEAWRLR
jgi:dienelactone hydrolase